MKTLDEVIFEAPYSPTPWEADALHYLKEYQRYQNTPSRNGHMALVDYFDEQQKNEPLDWVQLKEMDHQILFGRKERE